LAHGAVKIARVGLDVIVLERAGLEQLLLLGAQGLPLRNLAIRLRRHALCPVRQSGVSMRGRARHSLSRSPVPYLFVDYNGKARRVKPCPHSKRGLSRKVSAQ